MKRWVAKQWFRINRKRSLNRQFTAGYYKEIINAWGKEFRFIDFHSPPERKGIILRHDIDADLDLAVRMAEMEAGCDNNLNRAMFEHGDHMKVKATYFALNTAPYWKSKDLIPALLCIQELGHEIGWHNNSATQYFQSRNMHDHCSYIGDLRRRISEPIEMMRSNGIIIRGSSAHGDRLCYKYRYHNYNVFGFRYKGWSGYDGPIYPMQDFGLEYEAYHVPYDYYLADNHYGWNSDGNVDFQICKNISWRHNRVQVIIHPQNWRI